MKSQMNILVTNRGVKMNLRMRKKPANPLLLLILMRRITHKSLQNANLRMENTISFIHLSLAKGGKRRKSLRPIRTIGKGRALLHASKQNVEAAENRSTYSNKSQVPEKEEMRVHQQDSRHSSSVPSVQMTMKPTHVNMSQPKLPKARAQKFMRQKSETITLRNPSSGMRGPNSLQNGRTGDSVRLGSCHGQ
ncbi:hypothetical protein P3S68_018437 [Capsicum galapagoense]